MKKPLCLIACLLLAGCTDTDWNRALNYGGMTDAAEETDAPPGRTARPAPQPATAEVPGNSDFCKTVAAQDASRSEFDAATKARMFTQNYAQCLTIYTR